MYRILVGGSLEHISDGPPIKNMETLTAGMGYEENAVIILAKLVKPDKKQSSFAE